MAEPLKTAYEELEKEITACLKEHRGNSSVVSTMLNTLLAWPDHPYGFGTLYGSEFNPETKGRESFVIAETVDLDPHCSYAKEGVRAATLRASVPTHKRETWYREKLKRGIDVAICHPKIVETGLDLLDFPTILFHETGYSLHTLRQSSRRSWRIGQRRPVEVKFFAYAGTMQEVCLRLMGKKLLVALAMEGKFASEGLQAIDGDDDMLTAMARELVQNRGIGESADLLWKRVGELRSPTPASLREEPEKAAILQEGDTIAGMLPLTAEAIANAELMPDRPLSKSNEHGQLSLF